LIKTNQHANDSDKPKTGSNVYDEVMIEIGDQKKGTKHANNSADLYDKPVGFVSGGIPGKYDPEN